MSKPEPAIFTKEYPCTKLHVWNAFRGRRGFIRRQVDEAHAIMGTNAPKHQITKGYVEKVEDRGSLYYKLTAEGEEWLLKKFKSHLAHHPEDREEAAYLPKDW